MRVRNKVRVRNRVSARVGVRVMVRVIVWVRARVGGISTTSSGMSSTSLIHIITPSA